jgi:hypothetical protein
MVIILSGALVALFSLFLVGLPVALWLRNRLLSKTETHGPVTLAFAILAGFAVSSLAAATSYGIFGVDTYPVLLAVILLLGWLLTLTKMRTSVFDFLKDWNKSDLGLLVPVLISVYFARPYWSSFSEPIMRAGDGPDTTQNLMAAQSLKSMGDNWFQQSQYFKEVVSVESLRSGVMELYRMPSFREQAGIDYLVYGTRWGLTVPYSQFLRFFGNHAILWETGLVFLTSIMALSCVIFAACRITSHHWIIPILGSSMVASNTPFMVQYFNGGLSQAWSVASTAGFFLGLILFLSKSEYGKSDFRPLVLYFALIWLGASVTYIDASIVLVLFSIVLVSILSIFVRQRARILLKVLAVSGFLAASLVPIFTYATALTFDYRLKAATGTGIPSTIWPLPSELMGFVDIFTSGSQTRTSETLLVALVLTSYILFKVLQSVLRKSETSWLGFLGLSSFIVFGIGFFLSVSGRLGTNYIYLKVSTYIVPLTLIVLVALLDHSFNKSAKPIRQKVPLYLITPIIFALLAFTSGANSNSSFFRLGMTVPSGFTPLLEDRVLQDELKSYNYLTPYIISSNLLGVLGDVHWISKAPNDLILDSRMDKELRLICFSVDTSCQPKTPRIPNPKLESFGLFIFESPMTTKEFAELTPRLRFDENFRVFGQDPQVIPERFIGGNPYYND